MSEPSSSKNPELTPESAPSPPLDALRSGDLVYRVLSEYVAIAFGDDKTASEIYFVNAVLQTGKLSLRLMVYFLFLMWYTCAVSVQCRDTGTVDTILVRCEVPELENYFNDTAVLDISQKNRKPPDEIAEYCTYDDRNYTELVKKFKYDYVTIMNSIRQERNNPRQIPCKRFRVNYLDVRMPTSARIHSIINDFRIYCNNSYLSSIYWASKPVGLMVSNIFIGVAADIFGRKTTFIVASLLHVFGLVVTFVPYIWSLALANFFVCFGTISHKILYILLLEMCSNSTLLWMGFMFFFSAPLTYFLHVALMYCIEEWKYEHLANSAMMLALPFGMWYINESPRWLMFVGYKAKAWRVLKDLGSPAVPNHHDSYISVNKRTIIRGLLKYFKNPVFYDRILICSLLFFLSSVTVYVEGGIIACKDVGPEKHLVISDSLLIITMICACVVGIRCGRKTACGCGFVLLLLVDGIVFTKSPDLEICEVLFILLHLHMAIVTTTSHVLTFYVIELFPTPCRATMLGFCMGAHEAGIIIQQQVRIFLLSNKPKPVMYMPAFVVSVTSTMLICLLPRSKNEGLPDIPREAHYMLSSK